MSRERESDLNMLRGLDGLFVGQLSSVEHNAFDRLCKSGDAHREYADAAGFLGIARVRIHPSALSGN